MGLWRGLAERHERHIWLVWPGRLREVDLLSSYEALMSPEEHERRGRFLFERDQRSFLVTRALVRTTLSKYIPDVAPEAWEFSTNAHGRPEIAGPASGLPLRFNISHTNGAIVCLVHLEEDAGIDVESTRRVKSPMQLADHFFSPLEVAALEALPVAAQRGRFFRYWTLKEAYIKAKGMGLAIPLDHFSFLLGGGEDIAISFAPELRDDPATWRFVQGLIAPDLVMAAAIQRAPGCPPIRWMMREVVPLTEQEEPFDWG